MPHFKTLVMAINAVKILRTTFEMVDSVNQRR